MARYSEAHNKASQKYQKANYERIALSLPKGYKDRWKESAEARGESLAEFIRIAVEMRIKSEASPEP